MRWASRNAEDKAVLWRIGGVIACEGARRKRDGSTGHVPCRLAKSQQAQLTVTRSSTKLTPLTSSSGISGKAGYC